MMRNDSPGDLDRSGISDLDDDQRPEEMRVEIEQTRTEMTGTIEAIQRRLAPETLTEQAKDVARDAADQAKTAAQEVLQDAVREVREAALEVTQHAVHEVKEAAREVTVEAKDAAWDATVGRAEDAVSNAGETAKGLGATMLDTIKQNPVPAALAAISLGWLYTKRSSWQSSPSTSYGRGPAPTYPARSTYEGSWREGAQYDGREGRPYDSGRSAPGYDERSTVGAITDTVTDAASQAGEKVSDVASSAGQMASNAASSAGRMASNAGETAVDTGADLLSLVRANPIPSALVGLGLGWLYMNRSSGQSDYDSYSADRYRYTPESAGQYRAYDSRDSYGAQPPYGTDRGVGDMAREAGDRVSDAASGVAEQAGDLASAVGEQASDMAGAVMDRTRRAPGQLARMIEDNPLLTAALAASVGGAVGLYLPSTRTEDQLVGKSRDRVMGRAQEMKNEAMDKVQTVAKEVQTSATKEAQTQGLTV